MTDVPPRITSVRFAGLRTAASARLELGGLTVLIGPNGVGKSTVIEGLELLRRIPSGEDFLRAIHDDHGGPSSLLAHDASELRLTIDVEARGVELRYQLALARGNGGFTISNESLERLSETRPETRFVRDGDTLLENPVDSAGPVKRVRSRQPLLPSMTDPDSEAVVALLDGIDVHTGFVTQAAWSAPQRDRGTRSDNIVQATPRLARGGANLANAFYALRNRDDWQDTLETVRVVVDEDIRDVTTHPYVSGGSIGLEVKYRTGTVPSFALSDGTLALLALVAIAKLDQGEPRRSLLVLDEPDLHLHPTAIPHVVALLEACAQTCPVVVATHSDHFLDCLAEPARSTVLCDLDEHRHLRLRRPDAALLARWLPEYRGVGRIRAEGYAGLVFPRPPLAVDTSSSPDPAAGLRPDKS